MSEIQIILSFLCFAFLWFVFVKNKPKLLNKECAWCGSKNKINEHTFNGTKERFCSKNCAFSWSRKHYQCYVCGKWGIFTKKTLSLIYKSKTMYFCRSEHFYEIKYKLLFSNSNLKSNNKKNRKSSNSNTDQFLPDLYSKDISTNLKDGVDIIQDNMRGVSDHFKNKFKVIKDKLVGK